MGGAHWWESASSGSSTILFCAVNANVPLIKYCHSVFLSILDSILIYVEIKFNRNLGMLDYEILYFLLHKNRITQKAIVA